MKGKSCQDFWQQPFQLSTKLFFFFTFLVYFYFNLSVPTCPRATLNNLRRYEGSMWLRAIWPTFMVDRERAIAVHTNENIFFSFKNTTFLCAARFYDVLRGGNWFLLMWLLNVSANRTSFDLKGLIDLTVAGEGMSEKRRGSFLLCQQVHLSRSGLIDLDRDACLLTTYHGWASLCTDWRYRGTFLFFYPKSGSMPFDNLSMSICWNKKKEGKSCQKNSNSH